MPKKIVWSPLSVGDISGILEYLNTNWNKKTARNFLELTESFLIQISNNPRQFPLIFKRKGIRKCVLTKHNSMFYRESKTHIEILRIFDTRQDPVSLNL